MADTNMTKAMRGEFVEITLHRLYEMREQAMAAARLHERGHSWMNWHWVAVLNELIERRTGRPVQCATHTTCDPLWPMPGKRSGKLP